MKASREQIQQLLTETILALCNNGLDYEMEMEVDGLLGITLDKKDVVLVKISEVIQGGKSSTLNKLKIFEEPNSTLSSPRSMPEIDQPLFFGKRNICSPMKNSKSAKRQRHESAPSGTLNGSRSRARSPYNLQDFPQDLSQASERFRHSSATLSKSEPLDLRPEGSKNGNSVSQPLLPDGIERGQGEIANESQKQTKEPIPQKQADLSGDALSIDSRSLQQDSPLAQQDQMDFEDGVFEACEDSNKDTTKNSSEETPSTSSACYLCKSKESKLEKLQKEFVTFHKTVAVYSEGEKSSPRPGVIPRHVAEYYQMMEFIGGSGVYVYPNVFLTLMRKLKESAKAGSKPPGPYIASELLSMFYDDHDYPTLTAEEKVPNTVRNAILKFALKEGAGNKSTIEMALDSRIKALQSRAKDSQRSSTAVPTLDQMDFEDDVFEACEDSNKDTTKNSSKETPSTSSTCYLCKSKESKLEKLQKEFVTFHKTVAVYSEGEKSSPRPGVIPRHVAEYYQMMEFIGGSGVYVYPNVFLTLMRKLKESAKAGSKPPGPYIASELLSMFYDDHDYPTLTAEEKVPNTVRNAILTFALKEGAGNKSTIEMALDSRIKALQSHAKDSHRSSTAGIAGNMNRIMASVAPFVGPLPLPGPRMMMPRPIMRPPQPQQPPQSTSGTQGLQRDQPVTITSSTPQNTFTLQRDHPSNERFPSNAPQPPTSAAANLSRFCAGGGFPPQTPGASPRWPRLPASHSAVGLALAMGSHANNRPEQDSRQLAAMSRDENQENRNLASFSRIIQRPTDPNIRTPQEQDISSEFARAASNFRRDDRFENFRDRSRDSSRDSHDRYESGDTRHAHSSENRWPRGGRSDVERYRGSNITVQERLAPSTRQRQGAPVREETDRYWKC